MMIILDLTHLSSQSFLTEMHRSNGIGFSLKLFVDKGEMARLNGLNNESSFESF